MLVSNIHKSGLI